MLEGGGGGARHCHVEHVYRDDTYQDGVWQSKPTYVAEISTQSCKRITSVHTERIKNGVLHSDCCYRNKITEGTYFLPAVFYKREPSTCGINVW